MPEIAEVSIVGDGRPWHRLQQNWSTSSQCAIKESWSQHDSLLSKPVNSVHLSDENVPGQRSCWCKDFRVQIVLLPDVSLTHTACQCPPNEDREEALDFINQMSEKVIGGN
jgi:hypothetical protein